MGDQWDPTRHQEALLFLLIEVGGQRAALPATGVVELHPAVEHAALPNAPEVVDGLVNVRGTPVAVLDLRSRFGLPRRPPQVTDHLVLARVGSRTVALRVDRAVDLVTLAAADVHAAVLLGGSALVGVATLPDGLLLIHDLDAFLSCSEAADLDAALQECTRA